MAKSIPGYAKKGHDIIKAIKNMSSSRQTYQVFQDWLELSAISISNSVDWTHSTEREEQYLQIIKRYTSEERKQLTEILALLIRDMTAEVNCGSPCDILGEVFHGLELHNKYHGQFFTPFHICEFMGQIVIDDSLKEVVEKQGYVSVCEPCVGSGGMVIGFAAAMKKNNFNYQQDLCVTACDIDLKCVHMAYLQLSLYGIPAIIIHGNSLSMEEWSKWYTPAYMIGMWALREQRGIADVANAAKEKAASEENQSSDKTPKLQDIELKINENGQFSLF